MDKTIELIKPYPGEDEVSFIKRKAYYHRIVKPRLDYGEKSLHMKLGNVKSISIKDIEDIDAFWMRYFHLLSHTQIQLNRLIDYRIYDVYNKVLRSGERLFDYMPDAFYGAFIDEFYTNPQHSNACDDKNLYDLYFNDITRPNTLFRKMNNIYLDRLYNEITLGQAISIAREQGEVILKVAKFSYGGHGVLFWNSTNDEAKLKEFMSASENVICQSVIKQHPELSRLNQTSVNTIRIMTFMQNGKVHALSSVLRMGINGARVDNASSGGIVCGIKPNGQLKEVAFDTCANKYMCHPQGTSFESVTIPSFKECINLATSLARRFCSVSRLIAWDLAIDETGSPLLIEVNFSGGQLDFNQLCNGPIFGVLTEEVLNDVFNNSYTLKSIIKSLS